MKFLYSAFLILCTFLVGCASPAGNPLVGAWKSNKELSINTFHFKKNVPEKSQKILKSLFGKLVVVYDKHDVVAYSTFNEFKTGKYTYKIPYKIVAKDPHSLAYLSVSQLTHEPEINHIHFDTPDRYWIYLYGTGWKEYFDRISEKTEQGAAANP